MDSPSKSAASPPEVIVEPPSCHIDIYEGKTVLSDDDDVMSPPTPMTEMMPRPMGSPEESMSIISSAARRNEETESSRTDSASLMPMSTDSASESFSIISSVAHKHADELRPLTTDTTASESFSFISSVVKDARATSSGMF